MKQDECGVHVDKILEDGGYVEMVTVAKNHQHFSRWGKVGLVGAVGRYKPPGHGVTSRLRVSGTSEIMSCVIVVAFVICVSFISIILGYV